MFRTKENCFESQYFNDVLTAVKSKHTKQVTDNKYSINTVAENLIEFDDAAK